MKIKFGGKIISRTIPERIGSDAPGRLEILYEKPEFNEIPPLGEVKVTLEYETPIEACLLCGSNRVTISPTTQDRWVFECPQCRTMVSVMTALREDAIAYFNQGGRS